MMKKLFCKWRHGFILSLLFLFVYQGSTLAGVTGKISGVVKNAVTGELLPGVNIVIEATTLGAATDADGNYFILNIPPGTYNLKASIVGYEALTKTGVSVSVDHTTPLDFGLRETTIAGQEVTVIAEREIIAMDVSASQIVSEAADIKEVPLIVDIQEYINIQAGIIGDVIRGGGLDQTQFMMDGLTVVDNRVNAPLIMVNLSAVKELSIIKGGFNAEYGNVRSGLINVITKEGSASRYNGSSDFRISPPRLKHSGESIFNKNSFYLRPLFDEGVCWVGTKNGNWDKATQEQYPEFGGWNAWSADLLADEDPNNDMTPQEAQQLAMWLHRVEGSDALMPPNYEAVTGRSRHEHPYGDKPDWNMDLSFGGPLPYNRYLGNTSFFVSYRDNWDAFALPTQRDYYRESNSMVKLTTRLSSSMKLILDGMYGEINSLSSAVDGSEGYLGSGEAILNTALCTGDSYTHREGLSLYWPVSMNQFDVYRNMVGVAFDHVLSPRTFYNIRISYTRVKDFMGGYTSWRNPTILRNFGKVPMDESPYGYWWEGGYEGMPGTNMLYAAIGAAGRDVSEVRTTDLKFDITSQINRYNQIKAGILLNYDDLYTHTWEIIEYCPGDQTETLWSHYPIRGGAYIQDKLEFEGMIANFGVRFDYNEPNADWYTVDRYSKYFARKYMYDLASDAPQDPAKGHLKISPRLGISHPISENSKLYFNYGHFYSMPTSNMMYRIDYGSQNRGITGIGNPSANLPRTLSYELGWEYNVSNLLLFHLAGYYKDVSDQTGNITYINYDGTVNYNTPENNNFQDVRGFELRIDKTFGRWITGWLNYTYMVTTSGYVGRRTYYQDENMQAIQGLQNPNLSRPIARPYFRANLRVRTPNNWGPTIKNMKPISNVQMNVLFTWRAGSYQTWDPLNTYILQSNLQWKDQYDFDTRFSKRMQFGRFNFTLFADFYNLLNLKYISSQGFSTGTDNIAYLESLHLPMYNGEDYKSAGYTGGNDKPGDVKSDEKPYINMPDREFLTYLGLRYYFFGISFEF